MSKLGIVGVGYVGERVLKQMAQSFWLMSRADDKCRHWQQQGHDACCGDLDDPKSLPNWSWPLEGLFYFAPPVPKGVEDQRMQVFLDWISAAPPQRMVYISTTGVYGNCAGDWVDEQQPLDPGSDRARRRVDAESRWRRFAEEQGVPWVILRVPGIYGPGRLPLERIQRGEAVLCPEEAPWSNRIHVDDLVACCLAAMLPNAPQGVYNVADDAPSTMTDYLYTVADVYGLPRPPCVGLAEAPDVIGKGMMSYLRESRRIDNTKMHEALGVNLCYPSMAEGLAAVVRST